MERYGCLIIGTVVAMIVLVGIVYLWSGWLNRPVGRTATEHTYWIDTVRQAPYDVKSVSRGSSAW